MVSYHHEVNLEKGVWQTAIQVIDCVERRVVFYGSVSEGYQEATQKDENDEKRLDGLLDDSAQNSDVTANFGFVQACH